MSLLLFSSLIDYLGPQDKARLETFNSWMVRLASFDKKALVASNLEELKSIKEEKQIFLNEIGVDVNLLRNFQRTGLNFFDRITCQTTVEGLKFVLEEIGHFYLGNPNFTMDALETALDKYILEKNKQKYTAPAA